MTKKRKTDFDINMGKNSYIQVFHPPEFLAYSVINRDFLKDPNISWACKGFIAGILAARYHEQENDFFDEVKNITDKKELSDLIEEASNSGIIKFGYKNKNSDGE